MSMLYLKLLELGFEETEREKNKLTKEEKYDMIKAIVDEYWELPWCAVDNSETLDKIIEIVLDK